MKLESLSPIQAMSKILCHHGVLFHLLIILQKREREKWEDGIKVEKNRKREKDTRLQNFLFRGAGAPWPKNKDFHYKGEMCA